MELGPPLWKNVYTGWALDTGHHNGSKTGAFFESFACFSKAQEQTCLRNYIFCRNKIIQNIPNQVISRKVNSILTGIRVNRMKSIRGEANKMQRAKYFYESLSTV